MASKDGGTFRLELWRRHRGVAAMLVRPASFRLKARWSLWFPWRKGLERAGCVCVNLVLPESKLRARKSKFRHTDHLLRFQASHGPQESLRFASAHKMRVLCNRHHCAQFSANLTVHAVPSVRANGTKYNQAIA